MPDWDNAVQTQHREFLDAKTREQLEVEEARRAEAEFKVRGGKGWVFTFVTYNMFKTGLCNLPPPSKRTLQARPLPPLDQVFQVHDSELPVHCLNRPLCNPCFSDAQIY